MRGFTWIKKLSRTLQWTVIITLIIEDYFQNASNLKLALLAYRGSGGSDYGDVSVSRSFHAVINRRGNVVGK